MSDKEFEMASNVATVREVADALKSFANSPSEIFAVDLVLKISRNVMPCIMCNIFERENCIEERLYERRQKEHLQSTNKELLSVIEHIGEYWNQDQNEQAMADALWHILEVTEEAITNAKQVMGDSDDI